jgi:hypothetical protein
MNPRKLPKFSLSILDPRYSLRARIALIIAILTIILSVILTLITGQISAQEFDRNIGRSLAQLSSNLAGQLGQIMFERRRELRLTASQSALFDSPDNAGEVRLLLNQLSETNRDYAWIGWIDATGKVIAGVDGLFEGSNVSDRRWFQQGSADVTTPYIGGVQEVPELASRLPARLDNVSRRYIDLAMPIRGKDRQLIGVLGAYIDTGFLRDQALAVERQFEKQNGLTITTTSEQGRLDVFVLDSDGTVLVGPRSYTSLRLSDGPKLALQSVTAARAGVQVLTETGRMPTPPDRICGIQWLGLGGADAPTC